MFQIRSRQSLLDQMWDRPLIARNALWDDGSDAAHHPRPGAHAPSLLAAINGTPGRDTLDGGTGGDTIEGRDGADTIDGHGGDDIIYGSSAADAVDSDVGAIIATRVASGLQDPVFAASAPGDPNRLFIIEQHTGEIKILDLNTNTVLTTPFLNIPDNQLTQGGEQGLLGLAFDPDYASNGIYYVNLTNAAGATEVWQYTRGANADVSNTTRELVISFNGTSAGNHNAGWMGFGPDGMLYIATGDGGPGDDPENNAQDINSLFGKILRLDVDGDDFPANANKNYAIPDGNPFIGVAGADEVYALGLRNPWRISFDSETGDMIIADVGQGRREEINFVPAGDLAGRNFGWVVREGSLVNDTTRPGNLPGDSSVFTHPIYDYSHGSGPYQGFAVTGGYVVRGPDPGAQGLYVFGDYASGNLWTMYASEGGAVDVIRRNPQLRIDFGDVDKISSFAQDGQGRIYVIGLDGEIHRLTFTAGSGDSDDTLIGNAGDDQLFGGFGDDTLRGGSGADDMHGGPGDDTYIVGEAGDHTIEAEGDGVDSVQSLISYKLAANVENLLLLGSADRNATGNSLANTLTGNSGANRLNGMGGADTMIGAGGSDVYFVNSSGDVVIEVGGGTDRVEASISYALTGNVENLTLKGSANIHGTGNKLANTIIGNGGDNAIDGGLGNDVLTGGGGADNFIFTQTASSTNRDTITDFNVAADTISLDNVVFTALGGEGALTANQFRGNGAAMDASDHILYNPSTGALIYDSNGSAAGGAVQIATLSTGLALTAADFVVI